LVVDLRRQPLEQVQIAAAAFLLRKIYKDMFRWGETERPRLLIALDEAHRVARDTTLPRIMKEGRKFGVVVISASQNLTDFHPEVLGNAGTKIVFRTNHPASRKVAGFLRGRRNRDIPEIVEQLPVGVAMVQVPEMPYAERVQMYKSDPE
jgi:DNA helicase HerA-like ATPase